MYRQRDEGEMELVSSRFVEDSLREPGGLADPLGAWRPDQDVERRRRSDHEAPILAQSLVQRQRRSAPARQTTGEFSIGDERKQSLRRPECDRGAAGT